MPPPRPPIFAIISSRSPPPAWRHTAHSSHSWHTTHASHARHATHATAEASHICHHIFEVAATSLLIGVILILPLPKVPLEPVLLGLLLQEPFPVGPLFHLLQGELDAPIPDLVLWLLGIDLLQQLHIQLINLLVSCRGAFKVKRVLLHLDFWLLYI